MSFLRKIGNSIARFMYGRNGVDQLSMVLLWGSVAVSLAASLVSGISDAFAVVGMVISYLSTAMWVVALFRTFSKNIYKRREENSKWLRFWWKIKNAGKGAKERHADKDHRYFTCKKCKAVCRVPVGKGKVVITCPRCGNKIEGKT